MKTDKEIVPCIDFKKIKPIKIITPDQFLNFLDFYNDFINHKVKKFKPIKGEFIL